MRTRKRRKSGGTRKYGRNEEKCKRYKLLQIREKNKIRRIKKHLKRHVNDEQSQSFLERLVGTLTT